MKTNAIVRIVIFSIVAVLLIGAIGAGVTAQKTGMLDFGIGIGSNISDGKVSSVGSVPAGSVRDIEIDWVAGSITIQPGDTDQIEFSESECEKESQRMVWKQSGDKLIIQFCKSQTVNISFFGVGNTYRPKDLVVTIPREWVCDELMIENVSSEVSVTGLNAGKIDVENVSGECSFVDCSAKDFDVNTVSGDVETTGDFQNLSINTVSGNCEMTLLAGTKSIELEGVSGDITVFFPENVSGFSASIDSASGELTSEFPVTASRHLVYGDGSCRIEAETVSGNVRIKKAVG